MQVQVSTFASKIPDGLEVSKIFMELMKQHDGSPSVRYAFYDIDILSEKLKEAKELV